MKKIKLAFYLITLLGCTITAQETVKILGDNSISPHKDVSKMQVFRAMENPSGISVIVCPGGSYGHLGRKVEGIEIAKWLNENNITAFVLYYRVGMNGNRYPSMIQDLQRTMQIVKENNEKYGINPDKLGVMGFSAGGHLVGSVGTYFDENFLAEYGITPDISLRPAFVAMLYPVITMTDENIVHKRSRKNLLSDTNSPKLAQKMSLELNVRSDMPPVFMMQCVGDKVVNYRNAVNYNMALKEKMVPHVFYLYDEPGHGFGIRKGKGECRLWHHLFIPWLEEIMHVNLITGKQN